ncbi:putative protein MIZU-KUSSEI 1 [Cocos nucifera]|uniref:Protein MIZU-KUSSEI 1 n=1 Tax=Cocos nucifera TaxID=13894 RepID=A0A8K0MZS1_COCNU|nr:putative protein MIZU-KUSSEI 1 [Cocos nucifera]
MAVSGVKKQPAGLGSRVTGTLFGLRHGHHRNVHLAFQPDPKSPPVVLIKLATTTGPFIADLASGPVRFVLECRKRTDGSSAAPPWEEEEWKEFCNGRVCGSAWRRRHGDVDRKVLEALRPVAFGAGMMPDDEGSSGDLIYMRARFEREVRSRDSEAFYMIGSESEGHPEISIFMLRF